MTISLTRLRLLAALVVFGGLLFPGMASGLPQFPIRFGLGIYDDHHHEEGGQEMDCRACHVNPTGGGMRNQHGRQFSIEKLPWTGPIEESKRTVKMLGQFPYLSVGTDFRFVYLQTESESNSPYKDTFFTMQSDIYVAFTPTPHLTVYYQDGLQGNREVFGMIHGLPANGHFKFGKFLPPYGLKLDDHTSFIRQELGFGNNFGKDSESGLEFGFADKEWFGNAALFNGSGAAPDDNHEKGISVTGGIKYPRFWLAGSYYRNRKGKDAANKVTDQYVGIYTAIHLGGISFLGEWDSISRENSSIQTNGQVAYAELSTLLRPGVVARVKYDLYDPNRKAHRGPPATVYRGGRSLSLSLCRGFDSVSEEQRGDRE
ncbi:hypothetical protein JYT87_00045 [Nitrospira defluvii]|nr:hypothetical protein [Nitrospira defluvii]